MADVANCMKSSTPCKANFGQMLSDGGDDGLSPEVREAMDRIFPQSASQFLQGSLSFEGDHFLSTASNRVDKDEQPARLPFASASSSAIAAVSVATTRDTTGSAAAISATLGISFLGHNSAVTAASSITADSRDTAEQANTWHTQEAMVEAESTTTELPKKMLAMARISRADFDIITSCDSVVDVGKRASRNASSDDIVSDNYNSGDGSDSEDMSRPFASITREKKKKRIKKSPTEPHELLHAKSVTYLSEHNVNSGDEFKTSSKSCNMFHNSAVINGSSDGRDVLENNFIAEVNTQNELLSTRDSSSKSTQGCNSSNYNSSSNGYSLDICPVNDLYKESMTANEDISNTSNSSAKENLLGKKRVPCQKLPKVKRERFHIDRHINKIKNTFPPCYVVLRKIQTRRVYNVNNLKVIDNVLSLANRVRCLKLLCDRDYLVCKKNRRVRLGEKLGYMNFLEEALLHGPSDDEFEQPQKRSLRKRAKNISYAEPCEDDIVEEFSSKRTRAKYKDESEGKLNESVDKQQVSDVRHDMEASENKRRCVEYTQYVENNNHGIFNKEHHGYPPSNFNSASVYHPNGGEVAMSASQHVTYSQTNSHNSTAPFLSYLSGLSGEAVPAVFPHHVPSFYPSMPLNISGNLPPRTYIEQAPFSYQVSSMGQDPQQLCVMNMNAKDIYMQLLSSSGVNGLGATVGPPTGNSMGIAPGSLFSQPLTQVNSAPYSTQAMFRPPVPVASVSHGSMMAPTSSHLSSLYSHGSMMVPTSSQLSSLYQLQMLNRPTQTTSNSIHLAPSALTSCFHASGHMNLAVVKPTLYTSYATSSSTNCTSAPMTTPALTRNSAFTTSASSSSMAGPVPFAPMPVSYMPSVQSPSMPNPSSHSRFVHTSSLQSKLPPTSCHGAERLFNLSNLPSQPGHGGERLSNLSNLPSQPGHGGERLSNLSNLPSQPGHGGERLSNLSNLPSQPGHGAERFASLSNLPSQPGHGVDRLSNLSNLPPQPGHGAERFASLSNFQSRLAPPPVYEAESFASLSNSSSQSRLPHMPNNIAEILSNNPSSSSQSRIYNLPTPISQSRSTIPSPISQSRSNIPSPFSQSRVPNLPSPISQSRTNLQSPISQSRSTIPSPISQSRSNIPSPFSQLRVPHIPSPISQSITNLPSPILQSRSTIPSPISQSRSTIPSPISQSRSNIPSPFSQLRVPHIPSPISQSITNLPNPFSQLRAPHLAGQSSQPNHISPNVASLPGPNLLQISSQQPVSAYPVGAVTPGYSATATSGYVVTLSSSVSSGQLISGQTATNGVLPEQHKRYTDQDLRGQRTTKRKRLEQKYPLPPGVIIKTERLDSPPTQSSTNKTSQPLLPPNSQLLSALVPGHGVISPLPSNSISVGNIGSRSGVVAAFVEGGQSGLAPASQRLAHGSAIASADFSSLLLLLGTSSTGSTTPLAISNTTTVRNLDGLNTTRTSLDAVDCQPYSRLPPNSGYPPMTQQSFTDHSATGPSNSVNNITSGSDFIPPRTPIITSFESSASPDIASRPSPAQVLSSSSSYSRASAVNENMQSHQQYPSSGTPAAAENMPSHGLQQHPSPKAAALSSFRNSLAELQLFVQAQADCGLRTGRLNQLKEVLCKKQQQYKALQKFVEASTASDIENRRIVGEAGGMNLVGDQSGSSEAEPFVID